MTWQDAIENASKDLGTKIHDARSNAEYLAMHLLEVWNKTEMRKFLGSSLSPEEVTKYQELVSRRMRHEPLQHITGETEFYGLRLLCSPSALIPRPDTEILVEETLKEAAKYSGKEIKILDMGTGSGIIALALASKLSDSKIIGIDISADALSVAEKNRDRLKIQNVLFEQIDFFDDKAMEKFSCSIDLFVSNPPYISKEEFNSLEKEVREFDPRIALTDESDGLSFYRRIAEFVPGILRQGANIIVEIGYGGTNEVKNIFLEKGFTIKGVAKDLQGIERVLVINR